MVRPSTVADGVPRLFDAVIFDVFGTLTEPVTEDDARSVIHAMADALSVDRTSFATAWSATGGRRVRREFSDNRAAIADLCSALRATVTDDRVRTAATLHDKAAARWLLPRSDATSS